MSIRTKNRIKTLGYFTKRIKDCGFEVWKIFNAYSEADPRRWTVLIDPGNSSVFITCFENKDFDKEIVFEFYDGGMRFKKNISIMTDSMEIIIQTLLDHNVPQKNLQKTVQG